MTEAPIVSLRRALMADAENLYEWRNAPQTRKHFFDSKPFSWDEHHQWLTQMLARDNCHLLIAHVGETPIGSLRYDVRDAIAEVSVYLKPGLTGKGLGVALLKAGNDWVASHLSVNRVLAKIIPANVISQKAFSKAGFVEVYRMFEIEIR